jgi:hypothetical protein
MPQVLPLTNLPTEPGSVIARINVTQEGFSWDAAILLPHFSVRSGQQIGYAWQMAGSSLAGVEDATERVMVAEDELKAGDWFLVGAIGVPPLDQVPATSTKAAPKVNPFDFSG